MFQRVKVFAKIAIIEFCTFMNTYFKVTFYEIFYSPLELWPLIYFASYSS